MNWQPIRHEPDDPNDAPIEYIQARIADYCDIDIFQDGGRYYVEAVFSADGEQSIGDAETLEKAKELAHVWAMDRIVSMLRAVGATGTWIVRGATYAALAWSHGAESVALRRLEQPHELVMVTRFPAGDGGQPGLEQVDGGAE